MTVMIQPYSCITTAFSELIIAADTIVVPKPENMLKKNSNFILQVSSGEEHTTASMF